MSTLPAALAAPYRLLRTGKTDDPAASLPDYGWQGQARPRGKGLQLRRPPHLDRRRLQGARVVRIAAAPKRHAWHFASFRCMQQVGRFASEADVDRHDKPAKSVTNDPLLPFDD